MLFWVSAAAISNEIHRNAEENIKKAQEKQKYDYDLRHLISNDIQVGDRVLLRNNKRSDRKGGKFSFKWLGPYIVSDMSKKGLATLENINGKVLKKRYNRVLLKPYIVSSNDHISGDEIIAESEEESVTESVDNHPAMNEEQPCECTQKKTFVNDQKPPKAIIAIIGICYWMKWLK